MSGFGRIEPDGSGIRDAEERSCCSMEGYKSIILLFDLCIWYSWCFNNPCNETPCISQHSSQQSGAATGALSVAMKRWLEYVVRWDSDMDIRNTSCLFYGKWQVYDAQFSFAFYERKCLQEPLCLARIPYGEVLPLDKIVLVHVRCLKKQGHLSAAKLISGKENNNCP